MKVAIVKYTGGNTQSVLFALERLGIQAFITDDIKAITTADKVIFPGVGAAGVAMDYLQSAGLSDVIVTLKQPVLGICLGMQLMCRFSEEDNVPCLGIFKETVSRFQGDVKVPHMGWNIIKPTPSPLFKGIGEDSYVYFIHSYYIPVSMAATALTNYGITFSAAIQKNNFYAVQFHPEKSGATGARILQNFLAL